MMSDSPFLRGLEEAPWRPEKGATATVNVIDYIRAATTIASFMRQVLAKKAMVSRRREALEELIQLKHQLYSLQQFQIRGRLKKKKNDGRRRGPQPQPPQGTQQVASKRPYDRLQRARGSRVGQGAYFGFDDAALVDVRDYRFGGETDVILANAKAAILTWPQMCGEVIESADTVFHFDPLVCERLFDVIDGDTDGKLTVQEIMTSGSDPKVAAYVANSGQPTLETLIHAKENADNDAAVAADDNSKDSGGDGDSEEGGGSGEPPKSLELLSVETNGNKALISAWRQRLKRSVQRHHHAKFLQSRKLHKLNVEDVMTAFLQVVDLDGDGAVDRAEWHVFIAALRKQRLVYLKQHLLIKRHCYFGLGLRPGQSFYDPCGLVAQRGWLPRGYLEDFWFYSCNNHPLLILFFTDPDNPFSGNERRIDFLMSCAVTLFGAALLLLFGSTMTAELRNLFGFGGSRFQTLDAVLPALVHGLFVSVPVMLCRVLGFYAVGCPCLLKDQSTMASIDQARHRFYRSVEEWASGLVLLVGVVLLFASAWIWKAHPAQTSEPRYWLTVCAFFPQTWLYWFAQTACVEFNPSPSFIQCLTCGLCCRSKVLRVLNSGCFGVGQWHEERAHVLEVVRAKIRDRGALNFALDPTSSLSSSTTHLLASAVANLPTNAGGGGGDNEGSGDVDEGNGGGVLKFGGGGTDGDAEGYDEGYDDDDDDEEEAEGDGALWSSRRQPAEGTQIHGEKHECKSGAKDRFHPHLDVDEDDDDDVEAQRSSSREDEEEGVVTLQPMSFAESPPTTARHNVCHNVGRGHSDDDKFGMKEGLEESEEVGEEEEEEEEEEEKENSKAQLRYERELRLALEDEITSLRRVVVLHTQRSLNPNQHQQLSSPSSLHPLLLPPPLATFHDDGDSNSDNGGAVGTDNGGGESGENGPAVTTPCSPALPPPSHLRRHSSMPRGERREHDDHEKGGDEVSGKDSPSSTTTSMLLMDLYAARTAWRAQQASMVTTPTKAKAKATTPASKGGSSKKGGGSQNQQQQQQQQQHGQYESSLSSPLSSPSSLSPAPQEELGGTTDMAGVESEADTKTWRNIDSPKDADTPTITTTTTTSTIDNVALPAAAAASAVNAITRVSLERIERSDENLQSEESVSTALPTENEDGSDGELVRKLTGKGVSGVDDDYVAVVVGGKKEEEEEKDEEEEEEEEEGCEDEQDSSQRSQHDQRHGEQLNNADHDKSDDRNDIEKGANEEDSDGQKRRKACDKEEEQEEEPKENGEQSGVLNGLGAVVTEEISTASLSTKAPSPHTTSSPAFESSPLSPPSSDVSIEEKIDGEIDDTGSNGGSSSSSSNSSSNANATSSSTSSTSSSAEEAGVVVSLSTRFAVERALATRRLCNRRTVHLLSVSSSYPSSHYPGPSSSSSSSSSPSFSPWPPSSTLLSVSARTQSPSTPPPFTFVPGEYGSIKLPPREATTKSRHKPPVSSSSPSLSSLSSLSSSPLRSSKSAAAKPRHRSSIQRQQRSSSSVSLSASLSLSLSLSSSSSSKVGVL